MEFKSLCTSSGVGGLDRVRGTPLRKRGSQNLGRRMNSTLGPAVWDPRVVLFCGPPIGLVANLCSIPASELSRT